MKCLVYIRTHHLLDTDTLKKDLENVESEILLAENKISQSSGYDKIYDLSNASLAKTPGNTGFVCFIRIPRSGSSLMTEVFRKLSTEHDFKFMRYEEKDPFHAPTGNVMKWLVENKLNPFMYAINHMYVDIEKNKDAKIYGIDNPTVRSRICVDCSMNKFSSAKIQKP